MKRYFASTASAGVIHPMIRFAKPNAFVLCAALGLLAAVPASAAAPKKPAPSAAADKDKAKPADKTADAGKPLLVASFGDWGVYHTQAAKGRVCYTLAQPKERAPADLKRDAAYAFISDRPGEGVRNEVSFIMGFDVANSPEAASAEPKKADPKRRGADTQAMAIVGDQSFELLAKTANLWVKNAAKEGQLIDQMRKAAKLQVKAASKKGNVTTDTYSLSGFAQALDRVQKDCPSK
jgi:invasion protein IalB